MPENDIPSFLLSEADEQMEAPAKIELTECSN